MKKKGALAAALAITILLSVSGAAAAGSKKSVSTELTPEAALEELQRRFDALPEQDKTALYDIAEKTEETVDALLDGYVEAGVLSEIEAEIVRPIMKGIIHTPRAEGKAPLGIIIPVS